MWPLLLDMSRDECKRVLRRLELEAYGSVVSALRAQGDLTKDKRKLLQELGASLNISMERHRAEVRRAVNDEKLATIADHMTGSSSSSEWAIEGRRLIPLMPRLVPQTVFTALANNVANITAAENAKIPPAVPAGKKKCGAEDEIPLYEASLGCEVEATGGKPARPGSPGGMSSVVSTPGLTQPKLEEGKEKSRKRQHSALSSVLSRVTVTSSPPPSPPPKMVSVSSNPPPHPLPPSLPAPPAPAPTPLPSPRIVSLPMTTPTPIKFTLSTIMTSTTSTPSTVTATMATAVTSTTNTTSTATAATSSTHKVIIVSSANASGMQRSVNVPIVKTVASGGAAAATSLVVSSQQHMPATPKSINGNVYISAAAQGNMTPTTVSIGGVPTTAYITSQGAIPKIRPKALPTVKPRPPPPRRGSIVIPVTPAQQLTTRPNLPQLPKAHVQIRHEGALKIISQTVPISSVSGTTKILPKPSFTTSGGTPIYVMTTAPSNITVVTRTVTAGSGTRLVTVNSAANPRPSASVNMRPVVSCATKPMQTVHITSQGPAGIKSVAGKPNVIVVQKGSGLPRGVVLGPGAKEMMSRVTKATVTSSVQHNSVSKPTVRLPLIQPTPLGTGSLAQTLNLPVSANQSNVIVLGLSQEQLSKNTVLADILQATGILGEGNKVIDAQTTSLSIAETSTSTSPGTQVSYPNNEWIQMDEQSTSQVNTEEEEGEEEEEEEEEESAQNLDVAVLAEMGDGEKEMPESNLAPQAHISLQEVTLPLELPEGQVVTLEEAVELLGQSNNEEARALLRQAGIEMGSSSSLLHLEGFQLGEASRTGGGSQQECSSVRTLVVQQSSSAGETSGGDQSDDAASEDQEGMEVVGHLDPQTGIFTFPSPPEPSEKKSEMLRQRSTTSTSKAAVSTSSSIDIFSTALASADIHLEPYQYMEENTSDSAKGDNNVKTLVMERVRVPPLQVLEESSDTAMIVVEENLDESQVQVEGSEEQEPQQ